MTESLEWEVTGRGRSSKKKGLKERRLKRRQEVVDPTSPLPSSFLFLETPCKLGGSSGRRLGRDSGKGY